MFVKTNPLLPLFPFPLSSSSTSFPAQPQWYLSRWQAHIHHDRWRTFLTLLLVTLSRSHPSYASASYREQLHGPVQTRAWVT